ncbi:DegT/DnrJ/EryC1/StrS family aminotransferase [Oligoflexia bacterium]|nr:DegT/DnrJ/EryC1/StrS family aminotransferase [Oligoflexia bacterium]
MDWKVPYIDLPLQFDNLKDELLEAMTRVMAEGSFILRQDVTAFEEQMAHFLGVKHVIGVNSGTDALYLSAKALELKEGDEVVTVAHSFIATLSAVIHQGAKPILVDIQEDFNMNLELVENAITEKTKAIIPVHLNGRLCQMDRLLEIAAKYNLTIIEDAAQALGAKFKGQAAGSFGLVGCFSVHPMKTLNCGGDGGFLSTNDDQIAEKLRLLRDHGQQKKTDLVCFGYNSRLDNLQAAILNVKFKYLPKWIARRRALAAMYAEALADLPLTLPPAPSAGDYFDTFNSYVIRSAYQKELVSFLGEKGVCAFVHIGKPLNHHKALGLPSFSIPVNEKICGEICSLPIYPEMTDEQAQYVIACVQEFFKDKQ